MRERNVYQLEVYDDSGVLITRMHFKTEKAAKKWAEGLKLKWSVRKLEGLEKVAALRFYGKRQ